MCVREGECVCEWGGGGGGDTECVCVRERGGDTVMCVSV